MTRRADQSLAQFDEHPLGSVIYDAQHLAHDLHLVARLRAVSTTVPLHGRGLSVCS